MKEEVSEGRGLLQSSYRNVSEKVAGGLSVCLFVYVTKRYAYHRGVPRGH